MLKGLLTGAFLLATAMEGSAMESLSQYTWKNRVLVLFGEGSDPKLVKQVDILKRETANLADRDMVVLQVTKDKVVPVYGNAPAAQQDQLRSELKASEAFELVLVGKDGGVKLRSKDVVTTTDVFDLIDRMPMRRAGEH